MNTELALTPEYFKSLLDLDLAQQRAVNEAVMKLQKGHESTHLHALHAVPFKAFGVNKGQLRVICRQDGGTLLLLHVGAHDAAIRGSSAE